MQKQQTFGAVRAVGIAALVAGAGLSLAACGEKAAAPTHTESPKPASKDAPAAPAIKDAPAAPAAGTKAASAEPEKDGGSKSCGGDKKCGQSSCGGEKK